MIAISGLDSSTGGALHRYHRDHGFDSVSSLDFFRLSFVTPQVAFITAMNL